MNLGAIATLTLDAKSGFDSTDTASGDTVDLKKYFVNPGKRPMRMLVTAVPTGSDSGTFDYKLQEAATTVDSDFSDISGAAITQIGVDADASTGTFQAVEAYTAKRYVRGYATIAGSTWAVAAALLAVKRDA